MKPVTTHPNRVRASHRAIIAEVLAGQLDKLGYKREAGRADRIARHLAAGLAVDPITARINTARAVKFMRPEAEYRDIRANMVRRAIERANHINRMVGLGWPAWTNFRPFPLTRDRFAEYYREERREWNAAKPKFARAL